jgi:lysine 6-dehydrogenase
MRIIVAGAGLIGRTLALDLAKKYEVTSVDIKPEKLRMIRSSKVRKLQADFDNRADFLKLLHEADLVVGALPGSFGITRIADVISSGTNTIDISFCPENPLKFNDLAIKKNVIALVDCGTAPGLTNMILGYHNSFSEVKSFKSFVGGLPFKREQPYEYKAPFSPMDVIGEYMRPVRMIEKGKLLTRPSMSEPEFINIPEVGTLEAFYTDGLRTLLYTMKVPFMSEKTLRYPGHADKIRLLKETGLFSDQEITVKGEKIKPVDFTTSLLFPMWELKEEDEDFIALRVIIEAKESNVMKQYTYNLFVPYDKKTKTHAMARTTSAVCAAVVNLVADKKYTKTGVNAPEYVGSDKANFEFVINFLRERGIDVKREEKVM